MRFNVFGHLIISKEKRQFQKKVDAKSEKSAKEAVYGLFGSNNRLKRKDIVIEKIEEMA